MREVVKDLRERGFNVITNPRDADLPEFLTGYRPDIIAVRGDERLVIQIASKASLQKPSDIEKFARAVQSQKGWSFEIVLTNPKQEDVPSDQETSRQTLTRKLNEAHELATNNFHEAAALLGWAIFESAARISMGREQPNASPQIPPSALIRQLYAYGIIGKLDFNFLDKTLKKRNALVHGFFHKDSLLNTVELNRLSVITQNLLEP